MRGSPSPHGAPSESGPCLQKEKASPESLTGPGCLKRLDSLAIPAGRAAGRHGRTGRWLGSWHCHISASVSLASRVHVVRVGARPTRVVGVCGLLLQRVLGSGGLGRLLMGSRPCEGATPRVLLLGLDGQKPRVSAKE